MADSESEPSLRPTSLYYKFETDSRLQDINPGYSAGLSEKQVFDLID